METSALNFFCPLPATLGVQLSWMQHAD